MRSNYNYKSFSGFVFCHNLFKNNGSTIDSSSRFPLQSMSALMSVTSSPCRRIHRSSLARALVAQGESVRGIDNFITGKRENLAGLTGKMDFREASILDDAALSVPAKMWITSCMKPLSQCSTFHCDPLKLTSTMSRHVECLDCCA